MNGSINLDKITKMKKSVAFSFKVEYGIENEGKGCFLYAGIMNEDVPKVFLEHFFWQKLRSGRDCGRPNENNFAVR